jgi:hypothetical protein
MIPQAGRSLNHKPSMRQFVTDAPVDRMIVWQFGNGFEID